MKEPEGNSIEYIQANNAPMAGFYSHAVVVDPRDYDLFFLAGQTGNMPGVELEPVIDGGLGPQTTQTLENILAVVEAAGGNIDHIVELKVFLKDSEETGQAKWFARTDARTTFAAAYMEFFQSRGRSKEANNLPARTMMWVSEVPFEYPTEDTLIEITAMVAIPRTNRI